MFMNRFVWGVLVLMLFCLPPLVPAARPVDWQPIDPAQLALTKPVVTPDADAEALLWDVWIEDTWQGDEPQTRYKHYLRIKLFNARAVEAYKQVDIEYADDVFVSDVDGRTVKPDGTILDLNKGDVFERTLVKGSGVKVKAKSFALRGLEPGVVIEYGWLETHIKGIAHNIRLDLQRDIPVQVLRYHVQPLEGSSDLGLGMQIKYFQQEPVPKERESATAGREFWRMTFTNLPAFHPEPFMAPEDFLRRWALVYYTDSPDIAASKYWSKYAREMYKEQKRKVPPAVAAMARAAVANVSTTDEQIARLIALCRAKVKRIDDDAAGLTPDEKKKLKRNASVEDTLANGYGTGDDVLALFLALAQAAGLDARYAALPDGSRSVFDPRFPHDYFIAGRSIAVRSGESWRFCDPAAMYLPAGMLRWQEEGQPAILADPDQLALPLPVTPFAPPSKSLAQREAKLRLGPDGTLEGEVREQFGGHLAARLKEANDEKSAEQREQALKDTLKDRLSTAELTSVVFENVTDPDRPLVRSYHVRVPGYAQRTGKRLFFQPSFFERGGKPVFTAAKREHVLSFPYAWSESDQVSIDLPPGFGLDNADMPAAVSSAPVAEFRATAKVVDGKQLQFERTFYFGGEGRLAFPVDVYPALKTFFDRLRATDDHTLTLKETAAPTTP